ncbi:MAG: pyrimidine-nucleoside phosphorylase [Lachnospiraceae bacterium]|nr:pyrimidine-nucleoside phosphorylase [Lachnospiraceae bacterium]
MRMYDLIYKKKLGNALTKEEIDWMVEEYTKGSIPDYQMSAFLMSVCFNSMNEEEITTLTMAMAHSGDMVDLSSINGIKVDKHSTGGVGDKTTLIIAPVVAACGLKVAKMSGRGLGHTGGTIDKLESIPGYRTDLSMEEFVAVVNEKGLSVIGQTGNLTPADKKLYALRDVTATVDSIPLIASSVMSKKLAAGSDCIVLDVTTGSGAFMKNVEDAKTLAKLMITIGKNAGRKMAALVTDMDVPLGRAIGNSIEVIEAVEVLKGGGPDDLKKVCVELAGAMLYLGEKGTMEECITMAENAIASGSAYNKLKDMVAAQGGNVDVLENTKLLDKAKYTYEVVAEESGYIGKMDAQEIGNCAMLLGAGRKTKESCIDFSAGIMLNVKTGDKVEKGEVLARFFTNDKESIPHAVEKYQSAITFTQQKVLKSALIYCNIY